MPDSFHLVAGNLALDFANTLDNRYDPGSRVELLPSYDRFMAFARQSGILTAAQANRLAGLAGPSWDGTMLGRAIELREALHSLFLSIATGDQPNRAALGTLNRFLAEISRPRSVEWKRNKFRWRATDFAATPDAPITAIVEAAATLLTSEELSLVRECSDPTCRWLFLDRSKNHTRRWCDMKICGNRAKARNFQARQFDAIV
jgi:predicted RNA-binding Zn ribbon-like protein